MDLFPHELFRTQNLRHSQGSVISVLQHISSWQAPSRLVRKIFYTVLNVREKRGWELAVTFWRRCKEEYQK